MSYDPMPGTTPFPVTLSAQPDQAQLNRQKTAFDMQMDKLTATLDVTETKKTFTSILALMTKGTVDLSSQIDQKLSN